MKNVTILALLLVSAFSVSSQVKLGVYYSYDNNLSTENIVVDEYTGYSISYDQPNYSVGLTMEKGLKNNFSIKSGVGISDKSFTSVYYCAVCDMVVMPETVNLRYLDIPVSLNYEILDSKFKLFGEIGMINQFNLVDDQKQFRNYVISGNVGAGVKFQVSKRVSANASLNYINSFIDAYDNLEYKNSFLSYRFGIDFKL
ncbi:outer membrane beta-barrel protein [Marinigracilibium pacificum]|uniref:Porin family protein n=1 Tax=Marinigracilibium pacificum TaxID=2729599 RepID=A0A848J1M3_9BACT|nr:outer membrane beta-barrel protein [Marinigracilibium pacificum]NMM49248.1 porin family protein [Marinigracilibium pacificum]